MTRGSSVVECQSGNILKVGGSNPSRETKGNIVGYSIMVEFQNIKIRDKMLKFLIANLKPFNEMVKEELEYVRGPTDDLSYGKSGHLIGFDFSLSGDLQSVVAYLICYWMIKRIPDSTFWYDGDETWPVPKECDEHGFHSLAQLEIKMMERAKKSLQMFFYKPLIKSIQKYDQDVHNELKRLTLLWDNQLGPN
jgi:hypothetical protein